MADKCCPHKRLELYKKLEAAKNKITRPAPPAPKQENQGGQEAK